LEIATKKRLRSPVVNFTNILAHLSQFPCAKKVTYTSSTKKLCAKLLYEKVARKMLVTLTPNLSNLRTFKMNQIAKQSAENYLLLCDC
jgi:hypothetical protein